MKTLRVLAVLAFMGLGVLSASTTADAASLGPCSSNWSQLIHVGGWPIQGWSNCVEIHYTQPDGTRCAEISCTGTKK